MYEECCEHCGSSRHETKNHEKAEHERQDYFGLPENWTRAYRDHEYSEEKHEGHHGLEHHDKEHPPEKKHSVFHYF